jgi:hypothetical protein
MWTFRRKLASGDEPPAQPALSFLAPDEVKALGQMPFQATLGVYDWPDDSVESFRPNRAFVELLQRVVEEMGMRAPELAHGVQDQGEGWLYAIDPRTPKGPDGRVSPEDIIGAFEVRDGELVDGSYQPNDQYRVLTENGMTQMMPAQREAFVAALPRRGSASADGV